MYELTQPVTGRKLQQWGYYWNSGNNRRWLYWAIPLIVVGSAVFIFAIVLYLYRRKRVYRQTTVPYMQPPEHAPVQGMPVTGWPDYSAQYHNDYSNFSSYPGSPPGQPGPSQGPAQGYSNKPGNLEMGVPPPGYPNQQYGWQR